MEGDPSSKLELIKRPFVCGFANCDKSYTLKQHLVRHTIRHHDNIVDTSSYPCDECAETFKTNQNLQKHILRKHNTSLPFKCDMCTRTFKRHTLLAQHLFLHTGERLLSCNYCHRSFTNQTDRYRHESKHKTFRCECGEKFGAWSDYLLHCRLAHGAEEYHCDICKKVFKSRAYIVRHMKIHNLGGERSIFLCPFCPKFYPFKCNLKHHIESVHNYKTYDCTYSGCGAKLSTKSKLTYHYKKHFEPVNAQRPREIKKIRKDTGQMKRSTAVLLSASKVSLNMEKEIICASDIKSEPLYFEDEA